MRVFLTSLLLLVGISAKSQDTYWQQQVDYTIEVALDDERHILRGQESFTYYNQSPDTLEFIIMHLWPNAYSNKRTALAKQLLKLGNTELAYATPDELGYIDSLAFTLDGLPCVVQYDEVYVDICTLLLERPLPPGDQVLVATPFRVKLPSGKISRLGHVGQSYQITQWYPKPAVYDTEGWHGMPYLTQGEFYSEFGTYDVTIMLPENYTVGATGDLQTKKEIERLDSLVERTEKRLAEVEKQGRWKEFKELNDFPESAEATKTLRFVQSDVHDFAWFADKRFMVLKGEVETPHTKQQVTVWTMFTNNDARLWKESIEYMHDAVYYYSLWNGDYPYRQATAVDGTISAGGGMEYPNVTVIGRTQSSFFLETVIMHEVGHNWFYGILGSNERDHPWMDEGINSYNEQRYLETKYPAGTPFSSNNKSKIQRRVGLDLYQPDDLHYFTHLTQLRRNQDQPLNLPSTEYRSFNYAAVVYSKPALTLDHMRLYLGDSLMDASMQAYFDAYKYKHPQPEDFQRVVQTTSGKDMDWFFDDVLTSTKKMDWTIGRPKKSEAGYTVRIQNLGGIAAPIPVSFTKDSVTQTMWLEGFKKDTLLLVPEGTEKVSIDADWLLPEVKRDNNVARTKGLLRRVEPLEIQFLAGIENPEKNQLFYAPVLGLNEPNGAMIGLAMYNTIFPVKKWNFLIVPMISTKTLRPVGHGEAYYMFTPVRGPLESLDLGLKAKHYAWWKGYPGLDLPYDQDLSFSRFEPYLRFDFKSPNPSGFYDHEFTLSSVVVNEQFYGISEGTTERLDEWNYFNRFEYKGSISHPILATSFKVDLEQSDVFSRTSFELINDYKPWERLSIVSRVFAGGFISTTTSNTRYAYQMMGQDGNTDYTYDYTVLDRSGRSDFLSRQMLLTHGALKTPVNVGSSLTGLAAYNGEVVVKKVPIGLFADVGYTFEGDLYSDAGIAVKLGKRFLSVYVPLVYTNNIQTAISQNNLSFTDLIRFQIGFNRLDLLELRRQLSFL